LQKWQKGIVWLALGALSAYFLFDLYDYNPPWMNLLYSLFTIWILGTGAWDLLAPATMLTCPKCGFKTRHYKVRSKGNRRVFKCDVCGNKGIVSPPKAIQPAAPKPKGFCINCGKELVGESKFCPNCGTNQPENTS
jgi:predicted RNA-binding Zn-ribbon protein involved in translation (DUF1610 family)